MSLILSFGFLAGLTLSPIQNTEEAFYSVPVDQLKLIDGELPKQEPQKPENWDYRIYENAQRMLPPWALIEAPAEAFLSKDGRDDPFSSFAGEPLAPMKVHVRAAAGKSVTGWIFIPELNFRKMRMLRFQIEPEKASPEARSEFFKAKESYYRKLSNLGIPGGAWFRFQADHAKKEQGGAATSSSPEPSLRDDVRFRPVRQDEIERTFDLFTGGRALSENLQLDRAMPSGADAVETVALDSLEGIKIKAFDWKAKLEGKNPTLDSLASFIPADQFAIFFPSFQAMTDLMDEADRAGTPLLQALEPRAEDAMTKSRYEKQLCLEMSGLARLLGPTVIEEVAMTASDPYLREGTDVAILFRAKPGMAKTLVEYVRAKQKAAGGMTTPDRSVSSFLAEMGENVVVVANSEIQIRKTEAASKNASPSLASQDEYRFFRSRYEKGDGEETALLILPDAAIRNWCSARWRIAESRRVRAAAMISQLQAEYQGLILEGKIPGPKKIGTPLHAQGGGDFYLHPTRVAHSIYGSSSFLTPIAEIPLEKVTQQEANFYKRWKEGYERNWSNFFDPIAVRFTIRPEQLGADVSVFPLIVHSEYRSFVEVLGKGGSTIRARAGDPHNGTLFHYAMAIDPESAPIKQMSNFARGMAPQLKPNPFGWLGQTVALYADDDPVWKEISEAKDIGDYFETHPIRLPIALWAEVKNPLGVTVFLTAIRATIEQTAPGMTSWEALEEKGQSYVKITAKLGPMGGEDDGESGPAPKQMAVYYAVTSNSLFFTLDEGLLKRALARAAEKESPKTGDKKAELQRPWLGASFCLQADAKILDLFQDKLREGFRPKAQGLSWGNLPILNEWKKLYPGRDPIEVHRQIWGSTLTCPGGGDYVWDDKQKTMSSTAYGNPAEPKDGPGLPETLKNLRFGNFGLSFEDQGLRAKAIVERARN